MSIYKDKTYEKVNDQNKWISIIVTDYKDNDEYAYSIKKDVENIKGMLQKLGFKDENVNKRIIHNKEINVINKTTSDFCTFDAPTNDGYIMMFILTPKKCDNQYFGGTQCYKSEKIQNIFVVNNLSEWADKPKLIFYQNPMKSLKSDSSSPESNDKLDSKKPVKTEELPIVADIFESFSNSGDQDSYGDENGSFYIQALCQCVEKYIEEKKQNPAEMKNHHLMKMMYEVHESIRQKIQAKNPAWKQTPYFKCTFHKNFEFPVLVQA